MIAVGYEGEEEVVEGVWEHWDRNVSRINRIEAKGRCEKHLPFAVYMNFVKKGVEMMWI